MLRRARIVTAIPLLLAVGAAEAQPAIETTRFEVPGLEAPVEILVDRWGVAHVFAGGQDDLFFAQGWNAARDRLWQIDLWRRRGEGTLSEVFGPDYVEQDRAARLFLYRGDMHSEWLAYASDTKRIVTAWVRGVNAYVDLVLERPELMPPEFEALGYEPSHWTPEAVPRIRSHGLLRNARSEIDRARFLALHGPGALELRDHYQPAHDLVVPDGLDPSWLDSSGPLATYGLATRSVRFDELVNGEKAVATALQRIGETGEPADPDLAGQGSNNWAVSPVLTSTGRPLLANDPHRTQAVPSLRYIVHLRSPGPRRDRGRRAGPARGFDRPQRHDRVRPDDLQHRPGGHLRLPHEARRTGLLRVPGQLAADGGVQRVRGCTRRRRAGSRTSLHASRAGALPGPRPKPRDRAQGRMARTRHGALPGVHRVHPVAELGPVPGGDEPLGGRPPRTRSTPTFTAT